VWKNSTGGRLNALKWPIYPRIILAAWLAIMLAVFVAEDVSQAARSSRLTAPVDCSAQIAAVQGEGIGTPDIMKASQTLIDPVLSSADQVTERLQTVQALHTCLEAGLAQRDQEERRLYTLSEYFLVFAGGYQSPAQDSACYRTEMGTSDDPAVIALRDQALIPAPVGYIFVCFYRARSYMPDLVGRAFADPGVKGVTFLTRYVAVLDEKKDSWPEQALQVQTLPATVSHELVHAYVNAALGAQDFGRMPLWYQEGVAIYFSGSGEEHRVVTPNFSISQTSPADYRQYDLNFKYLQAKLGRAKFLDLIRRSVAQADASILLQDLGIHDEAQLVERSNAWASQRALQRMLLVLAGALFLGWGLVSLAPEAECVCGYQGRRNDFREGDCPRCGRRVFRPPSVARRLFSSFAPGCEVCGRRFPPWRRGGLVRYTDPLKVWIETRPATSGESGRTLFARNVCARCARRSVEIEAQNRSQATIEIENERPVLSQMLRAWLQAAPRLPDALSGWAQMLPFEEAVEQLSLAALERLYYAWMDVHAEFQFVESDAFNPADAAPPSYDQIIHKISYQDGSEVELFGTIYRSVQDRIGIVWSP
jgi:hypothetical protein